jgi:hypothetical protein
MSEQSRRGFLGWLGALVTAPVAANAASVSRRETIEKAIRPPLRKRPGERTKTQRVRLNVNDIRDKNVLLTVQDYAGVPIAKFRGIPIRIDSVV